MQIALGYYCSLIKYLKGFFIPIALPVEGKNIFEYCLRITSIYKYLSKHPTYGKILQVIFRGIFQFPQERSPDIYIRYIISVERVESVNFSEPKKFFF